MPILTPLIETGKDELHFGFIHIPMPLALGVTNDSLVKVLLLPRLAVYTSRCAAERATYLTSLSTG